jgi:hypothetical protein
VLSFIPIREAILAHKIHKEVVGTLVGSSYQKGLNGLDSGKDRNS